MAQLQCMIMQCSSLGIETFFYCLLYFFIGGNSVLPCVPFWYYITYIHCKWCLVIDALFLLMKHSCEGYGDHLLWLLSGRLHYPSDTEQYSLSHWQWHSGYKVSSNNNIDINEQCCLCVSGVCGMFCVYIYIDIHMHINIWYGGYCIDPPPLSNQPHVSSCYSSILTFYGINAPFEWHPFSLQSLIQVKNKTYCNMACRWFEWLLCCAPFTTTAKACPHANSRNKWEIQIFRFI